VALLTRRGVEDNLAEALAAQKEQRIPDFPVGVIKPLPLRHFADMIRGNRNFLAPIKLQQTFVSYFLFSFHKN